MSVSTHTSANYGAKVEQCGISSLLFDWQPTPSPHPKGKTQGQMTWKHQAQRLANIAFSNVRKYVSTSKVVLFSCESFHLFITGRGVRTAGVLTVSDVAFLARHLHLTSNSEIFGIPNPRYIFLLKSLPGTL